MLVYGQAAFLSVQVFFEAPSIPLLWSLTGLPSVSDEKRPVALATLGETPDRSRRGALQAKPLGGGSFGLLFVYAWG
jgi:hypothetical protein